MSASLIKAYMESRLTLQLTKDGKFVKVYKSIAEAARETGICRKSINNVMQFKANTAGGYVWRYRKNTYKPMCND